MITNKLPHLGTPESCIKKMKESYTAFVQSAAFFITLANYYSENTNRGKKLEPKFASLQHANVIDLQQSSNQDFIEKMEFYAVLPLELTAEIKENLDMYQDVIENGQDNSLSDYDKCCDTLTIKDEFTDLKNEVDEYSKIMMNKREINNKLNDPLYDPNAIKSI